MAVPRNRTSNARRNSRRAHHAKKPKNTSTCANCQAPRLAHQICPHCGFYRGRSVIRAKED